MAQSFSIPISRRDLLKLAGVTAARIAATFGIRNGVDANKIDWVAIPAHKRSYVRKG